MHPFRSFWPRAAALRTAWLLCALANVTAWAQSDGLPRGANEMPYLRYEAEDGVSGGGAVVRSATDFDGTNTASEASNRRYVGLFTNNSFVQWTVSQPADGVTLRFTLPDDATGAGVSGSLAVSVNGSPVTNVGLSSYWAWTYFVTSDPTNTPGGRARMRFDEVHLRLPAKLQPGDVLRLAKTNADAFEYGVDFVELEDVPAPLTKPAGFVSVADYGASGSDTNSDSTAFSAAWTAARAAGTGLYIPPGKYLLNQKWTLTSSTNLAIQGAGIWQTELFFTVKSNSAGGLQIGGSTTGLNLSHFFMNSVLNERFIVADVLADYQAFNGPFGSNSSIHHVWLNHFTAGAWLADYSAPVNVTTGFDFAYNRVRNTYADGINFSQGTRNSTARQCDFRDNGDDAMAVWPTASPTNAPATEGCSNAFRNNTVEFTYRAGGAGIFGGYGHEIHHCVIKDGVDNSGIRFTEDFSGYLFTNNTGICVYENTLIARGTSQDLFNNRRGAIEIRGAGIKSLFFWNNDILNSPRNAIQLNGGSNLTFTNITINATGLDNSNSPPGAAIYAYGANGSADFVNLSLTNIESSPAILVSNAYQLTFRTIAPASQYEAQVQFTGYDRAETLTNFPALVKFGPSVSGFAYGQFATTNGNDLRFRDAGGYELRYEIESWNTNGTSFVWVQVPALASNTSIWAQWGSANNATKPAYSTNGAAWTSFAAVYHANEGAGTHRDSSPNARHGTPVGNTTNTAGMIAGADAFDGNGDAVRLPAGFGLFDGTKNLSVDFWFKANAVAPSTAYQTSPGLFQTRAENSWMITFGDSQPSNSLSPRLDQGGWASPASAAGIQTNRWYHYAVTYAPSGSNNWNVYLDGMLVSQGTRSGAVSVVTSLTNYYGSADEPGTTRWFNGLMDEVRVSTVARSSNWVWATWHNVVSNNTFANYGAAQLVGNLPPSLAPVSNHVLNAGQTLLITNIATDANAPAQMLTFTLLTSVTNATLGASNGLFSWRPAAAQAGTTNSFSVVVADSGSPILRATQSFTVTVKPLGPFGITTLLRTNLGQYLLTIAGDTGPDYTVQATTNLANPTVWTNLLLTNTPTPPFNWTDTNAAGFPKRFYRVLLGP